ncbi:hypothetical protein HOY82DRAFT_344095 [Tuber indicum]|nr:hypothetical protein HOY82DRAFT_344095 [Tuber indicum]
MARTGHIAIGCHILPLFLLPLPQTALLSSELLPGKNDKLVLQPEDACRCRTFQSNYPPGKDTVLVLVPSVDYSYFTYTSTLLEYKCSLQRGHDEYRRVMNRDTGKLLGRGEEKMGSSQ